MKPKAKSKLAKISRGNLGGQAKTKAKTFRFPDGFLWGAAASAYQVEGGITNNDWAVSRMPPAGLACDQYHRYEEDFRIAKQLNQNAQRISLEWSRIEPAMDVWDEDALHHYAHELEFLKREGFTTFVTLQHLTLPAWIAEMGGWASRRTGVEYVNYVSKVAATFGQYVDFWITINEPSVHAELGYKEGIWPPFRKNWLVAWEVFRNILRAHNGAYDMIHGYFPDAQVGLAQNISYNQPYDPHSRWDRLYARLSDWASIDYPLTRTRNDFIGLNQYFRNLRKLWPFESANAVHHPHQLTDFGWEIYPRAIYEVLMRLRSFSKPVYITENGIADASDRLRAGYITEYLREVHRAIGKKVPVRGYFYWSLLDNYEWPVRPSEKTGYEMKFGLVKVDFRKGRRRSVRESAKVYAEICKTNSLKL